MNDVCLASQPMDLVVNAPLKAAVRRLLCGENKAYFNAWRNQRILAMARKQPLPPFSPPPFSVHSVIVAVIEACSCGSLATSTFKTSLRRVFVTVGIAPNSGDRARNEEAPATERYRQYHETATQSELRRILPALEERETEAPVPVVVHHESVSNKSVLDQEYPLSYLIVPTELCTQPDELENSESDRDSDRVEPGESDSDGENAETEPESDSDLEFE